MLTAASPPPLLIDASGKREIGGSFDQALQSVEALAIDTISRLTNIAERWPTDSPVFEVLMRQRMEFASLSNLHMAQRYEVVALARRNHT